MAKATSRKPYRKRRVMKPKGFSSKQTKAIKTIAKKVALSTQETKFLQYDKNQVVPNGSGLVSFNLFYHGANRGTGDNDIVGDRLTWRGIKIKYQVTSYGNPGRGWFDTPFKIHMMIIATKKYVASASLSLADIRDNTSTTITTFFPNKETQILAHRTVHVNGQKTGDRNTKLGSIWLKRNQVLTYKDFATDQQLTKQNYYLVLWGEDQHGLSDTGTCYFTYKNYFKDA